MMSMAGRGVVALVWMAAWLMAATDARADGKVFSRAVAAVNIPDQEALIHYADGVETLVIETRFEPPAGDKPGAAGEDHAAYAWVVPVPGPRARGGGGGAAPEVFATTAGVFPTLRAVCAPRVTHGVELAFLALGTIAALILLSAMAEGPVCLRVFVLGVMVLFLAMILLPSLGKARGGSRAGGGVEVFSREVIGSFDVAVVGAESGAGEEEVQAWLGSEGFHVPAEAGGVLAQYARDGWVFVAAKLRAASEAGRGRLTPHPLAVRFKAATPVYPMRLTAVGNRDLSLDLYVFADRRAEVEGMDVVRSGPVVRGDPDAGERYRWWADGREGEVVIGHRSLRALTGTASTVTKLSGVFTPRQMGRDLTIGWAEPRTIGAHKYSGHGASIVALNITGAAWLAAVIGVFVVGAVKKTPNRRLAGVGWAALAPCLLLGLVVRAALPTTDVVDDGRRPYRGRSVELITDALEADAKAGHSWSSADEFRIGLRGEMESVRARERRYARVELPRHQDSPGNYVVREGEGGSAEVVYFDGIGREEVVWRTGKLGR